MLTKNEVVILKSIWKLIIGIVGISVILIGIALLVLPGPGWLVIFFGLVILGGEFIWARKLLKNVKKEFKVIKRGIKNGEGFVKNQF